MELDKILIKLEKQGWKLEKDFLETNQNFLQDLVDETEKAINYTRCCKELKDKQPMTFEEWLNFNKYTKKTIGYERNQIRFGYEEMMQRYIGYKQSL